MACNLQKMQLRIPSNNMFAINYREEYDGYQYIQLSVHCDNVTFRRVTGSGDEWDKQLSSGEWVPEFILDSIVTECWDKNEKTMQG